MYHQEIQRELAPYHLLKHEYYQKWSAGELSLEDLQAYSCQYFHHVNAFPRYLSSIHTRCADIQSRQILLDNLIDEEKGPDNHPELWLRFAESLGISRETVKYATLNLETETLVNGFYELCHSSYAEGLGALYAYEQQIPEISKSKITGLKKFYNITNEYGLKFFQEHITADEWHSEECGQLIDKLPPAEQKLAKQGAIKAAKLLWGFLDGVNRLSQSSYYCMQEMAVA